MRTINSEVFVTYMSAETLVQIIADTLDYESSESEVIQETAMEELLKRFEITGVEQILSKAGLTVKYYVIKE